MNNRTQTANKKSGGKFSTSLIVGLLLVPLSAVAAVALVNPDAAAESEEVAAIEVIAETTTTTEALDELVIPEIASADDLALACGDQGWLLVTKEADATISPLEQAALDSLRAICLAEGLELPGPPAPDAVVQTVTVVAAPPPTTTDPGTGTDTGTDTFDEAAAEFEAEYAATVAYINKAIDDGAGGEKIAKAEVKVGEAASLADSGDYGAGMKKLDEARKLADEAKRGGHDDDDDDDDDDDEDDDDEDHEDEDDDDDEDDD